MLRGSLSKSASERQRTVPDTCIHGRRVAQSCPGCGNAPAAERERAVEPLVYRVTIPGNPGACKVNTRTTAIVVGRGARVVLSKGYRNWRALAVACMRLAPVRERFPDGPLVVSVAAYWPTRHNVGPAAGLPRGDVDAVGKACLDALGHAGIIGDDSQVMSAPLCKAYDRQAPRIEIGVWRA
jgi:Holliday junction resolvase RusA-like endonuclease